ncbi:MAG: DoxX family protein [Rikenellaceae bacterium]
MRTIDTALLYLRIVVGGMLLLHNIGRMQDYNTIIENYHSVEGIASPVWFLLFGLVESVAAVMLIVGWRVRLASIALVVGTILVLTLYFPNASMSEVEIHGIYTFIYIFLFISGGGLYSMDGARKGDKVTCEEAAKE